MKVRGISLLAWIAVIGLTLVSSLAAANERVALVIGNAAYTDQPLESPTNDAQGMAEVLRTAGFVVDIKLNASRDETRRAVESFGAKLSSPQSKFAVFYYAGHGVQIAGKNFLVPVTASIKSERDIATQAVELTELLRYMNQAQNKNFLVILDACRDDPFAGKFQPQNKGLSSVDDLSSTLLAFATAPGRASVEFEGEKNGLYTGILLKELAVKGAKLEDVFKRTRVAVRVASRGIQIPWENTSLEQDVYLFPTQRRTLSEDELSNSMQTQMHRWNSIKASRSIKEITEFVREFPSGYFAEHATLRLNALVDEERKRAIEIETARHRERERQAVIAATLAAERAEAEAAAERKLAESKAKADRERLAAIAAQEEAARQKDAAAKLAATQRAAAQQKAEAQAKAADEDRRLAQQKQEQIERELVAQRTLQAAAARARIEVDRELAAAKKKTEQLALASVEAPALHIEATSQYTGYSERRRDYRVGDVISYRIVDQLTKLTRPRELRVSRVDAITDRVEFNNGAFVSDLMGNIVTNDVGRGASPRQFYPVELFVGKRWTTRYVQTQRDGKTYTFDYSMRVTALENITVPAGTFRAYRIEAQGYGVEAVSRIRRTIWVVPGTIGDIAHEYEVRTRTGAIEAFDRQELVSITRG